MKYRVYSTLKLNPQSLVITHKGRQATLLYHWLRDTCSCPLCIHPSTRQKLFSTADIHEPKPLHVEIQKNELVIQWKSGSLDSESHAPEHVTKLSLDDLDVFESTKTTSALASRSWDGEISPFRLSFDRIESEFASLLKSLNRDGIAFVENVPTKLTQVEELAKHFGSIRETFYGVSWDVKNIQNSKNIAYTNLFLGLHMDLMYFESPPGLQFLHSIENSVTGGHSLFADSLKALEILKENYPNDYEVLKSIPVTFHYKNDGHDLKFKRPTIQETANGTNIFYAPPFQGRMDPSTPLEFYHSFKRWRNIVQDPRLLYRVFLKPGDCVIFLNRRVLHGRESFENNGSRHFRGTYTDLDDFLDKSRILLTKRD